MLSLKMMDFFFKTDCMLFPFLPGVFSFLQLHILDGQVLDEKKQTKFFNPSLAKFSIEINSQLLREDYLAEAVKR